MKLLSHNYGKVRVRLCKVLRDGPVHSVKELTLRVALEGDFAASYQLADNTLVVPTDTMKNTLNVLAYHHLGQDSERFALTVADHFLNRYAQVSQVSLELEERIWDRLEVAGEAHPHSFSQNSQVRPFSKLIQTRESSRLESGVSDFTLMKTTGSGFSGFSVCENTSLEPTDDRLLATTLRASWLWDSASLPTSFAEAREAILQAMVTPFARNYSASVQATLWEMARAAFDACPGIQQVTLALPNLHYFHHNLRPFGIEENTVLLLPTDEPHGHIEATIARE
ncbi:MAG TPA: urate oxidase [Verrucomicrobium sp.]|nr:urate oxidase [Verrucomicrobium sp.]